MSIILSGLKLSAMRSVSLTAVIVELSTALPDEWHKILIAGGKSVSTRLRSAAGIFGKRVNDIEYMIGVLKWYRRQYKLSRMKYPWYYMG